jgi:hypothetical protein
MSVGPSASMPGDPAIAPAWVPLRAYLANLERAAGGVVQVAVESGVSCTGWMLTDSLAVVPHYALVDGPDAAVSCRLPGEPGQVPARVEYLPGGSEPALPALIRLATPFTGRALALASAGARPDEPLLLLHYPLRVAELQLSQGHLVSVDPTQLTHDVDSARGSGGAPVLSAETGRVLGIHWGKSEHGFGTPLAAVLETLRGCPVWPEIADAHRLAEVRTDVPGPAGEPPPTVAPPESTGLPDAALLRAALAWTIDPEALAEDDRVRIRPYVDDPDEPRWSLPAEERRRLIAAAGSLEALRSAHDPAADPGPAGSTVSRILAGPPFDLAGVPDEDLPYWLQAVSWFLPVAPGLPSAADVHRELQARRVRGRLRVTATPRLWGREAELETLRRWFAGPEPPPMIVTGIGGMGKSALVARFALDLPPDTVILWLDFDRADLAPDNAVSVLSTLVEQLAVQHAGFTPPPVDESSWPAAAAALSTSLSGAGALLVLDGFEVAQHVRRHEELWGVLNTVLDRAADTRVVVSGRAPVPDPRLGRQVAATLPLTGIPLEAARAWLLERGIEEPAVLDAVLRIADGIPLLLKMAVRLVQAGDDVPDVLSTLPRELVAGYLYQRILDRVVDLRLRRLAHDALVLRRVTRDVLIAVLGDRLPTGLEPDDAIARLTRELALVETLDQGGTADPAAIALRLRPEVRVATLRLLEEESVERVRAVDRRAAEWYAGPGIAAARTPSDRVAAAAEEVYHRARLGDLAGARAAWVEGCAGLLDGADEDVPEEFADVRDWLRDQVAGGSTPLWAEQLPTWEAGALPRIKDAVGRGLDRAVSMILDERPDRSRESPLLVYDAWMRRAGGDLPGARELLGDALDAPGQVGWARTIVAARSAALAGDVPEADRLLAGLDPAASPAQDQQLAVTAARIRFTIDLPGEERLLDALERGLGEEERRELRSTLVPWDFVLPASPKWFGRGEYVSLAGVPEAQVDSEHFAQSLDQHRQVTARRDIPPRWLVARPPEADPLPIPTSGEDFVDLGHRLADLSVRRWRLAAHATFLADARHAIEQSRFADQIRLSVAGTLAAFRGADLYYRDGAPLTSIIERAATGAGATRADQDALDRLDEVRELLELVARRDPKSGLREPLTGFHGTGPFLWAGLPTGGWGSGVNSLLLLAFGPDPLEELERRVLGRPELKAK